MSVLLVRPDMRVDKVANSLPVQLYFIRQSGVLQFVSNNRQTAKVTVLPRSGFVQH